MKRAATSAAVVLVTVLIWDLLLRLLVRPSPSAWGQLFGQDLPPLVVVQGTAYDGDRSGKVWSHPGRPNPENLTNGDLQGVLREDATLGYSNQENTVSARGWSVSNNLGANSWVPTRPRVPAGKKRLFIFGESFGRGSRIPQQQAWSQLIQVRRPELEIVNMCVDGFAMGQAYRRFQNIQDQYDFDTVMFVCVPEVDAWRDMNTMRFLGEDWYAFTILPRYRLSHGSLEWVPGPYPIGSDIYRYDVPTLTPRVRDHLRQYDSFYFRSLYESPPLLGGSILYKIVARLYGEHEQQSVYQDARWGVKSEGMAVERAIFRGASRTVQDRGRNFVLVLLPSPELVDTLRRNPQDPHLQVWKEKSQAFASDGYPVIDLMDAMRQQSPDTLDRGFDGSHYGPRANAAIAALVEARLGR